MNSNWKWILFVLIGMLAITAMFAFAPLFHWLWFDLVYLHPTGIAQILLLSGVGYLVYKWEENRGDYHNRPCWARITYSVVAVLWVIFYGFWADGLMKADLAKSQNPEILEALPDSTGIRYLPMKVAEKFGANKIEDAQHHLGDMDPIDTGGQIDWVAPRVPTGAWNYFFGQTDGLQIVYSDGNVETVHQSMVCGEGMALWGDITWAMQVKNYWAEYPEIYYLKVDGEVLGIAPYVRYVYHFPVRVPVWGGVMVVHANCRVEDLSPAQAMADPRFTGQRLYPEKMAKAIADAWGYRGGVANAWFGHHDQTEVPTIEGEDNQMPYLVSNEDGPAWFVGFEPYGPAYSIFKIMYADAHNGKLSLYNVPSGKGIVSPNKAAGYVRGAFPNYTWNVKSDDGESGTILAIEPKPMVKDGTLYWQVSITSTDYANVSKTAFLNGDDDSVVYVESIAEMRQFMDGVISGHPAAAASTNTQSPDVTVAPQTQPATLPADSDLKNLSVEELLQLLEQITEELKTRDLGK